MGRHNRQVHVAGLLDGFAAVHGFQHGEFAHLFLDDAGDAEKVFAPFAAGHFAPDFVVGAAGGLDGAVHVLLVAEGDFCQLLFRGGINGIKIFSGGGRDKFTVDEQLVPRRDDVILGLLRRGRVIPPAAEVQSPFLERYNGVGRSGDSALGGEFHGFEFGFHAE